MNHDEAVVAYIKELANGNPAKTVLQKLLYAAELHYLAKYGKRLTGYRFKHWEYGPYAPELDSAIGKIDKAGQFSVEEFLPEEQRLLVRNVVAKYGSIPYGYEDKSGLKNYVYQSIPFLLTNYGDEIDFLKFLDDPDVHKPVIKAPEAKKIKERAEAHREMSEQVFSEEGVKAMEDWLKHG